MMPSTISSVSRMFFSRTIFLNIGLLLASRAIISVSTSPGLRFYNEIYPSFLWSVIRTVFIFPFLFTKFWLEILSETITEIMCVWVYFQMYPNVSVLLIGNGKIIDLVYILGVLILLQHRVTIDSKLK